jgi:replication factor A1
MGMYDEKRGRPRGRSNEHHDYVISIVLLARKHDLDAKQLADAFFEALEERIVHLGSLKISCREVNQDSVTFLITKEERVVWQSAIRPDIMRDPAIRDYIENILQSEFANKKKYQKSQKIGELRFGMKEIDVRAKITEIPPTRRVITRFGTPAKVSNVMVADETGSIRLSLWNDQIDQVHSGDEVELSTCNVARFRGELQLRLGRKGTISTINQPKQEELIQYPSLR